MRKHALIAAAVVVASVVLWALFLRGSDEDLVRKTVSRAAAAIQVDPTENPLLRATRVRSELLAVLAPEVSTTIPELSEPTKGRDALIGLALATSQAWQSAEATVLLSRVTMLKTEPPSADVDATLTLAGQRGGGSQRDVRKVRLQLEKRDGAFRITEITVYPSN